MTSCSTGLIDLTQSLWGSRGVVLSPEQAREVVGNFTGFFSTLHRISVAQSSSS